MLRLSASQLVRTSAAHSSSHLSASITAAASSHVAATAVAIASSSSSSSSRSFHRSSFLSADPAPKGGKVAGAAPKKKKDAAVSQPMVVPTSMSQYHFNHLTVWKEYKTEGVEVPVLRPDAAYPPWIWDQTPEPTWSELLLADFQSLTPTYQKKIFSIPRKQAIKKNNDRLAKG